MKQIIIKNAIRCKKCGEEIESTHRHDYVECKCKACAVDGGHDYLRRCYVSRDSSEDYEERSIVKWVPEKEDK